MIGQPLLNVLSTPQQPFGAREAADGWKGSRIARGVATNASDGLVEALRQLLDRQKDGQSCCDRSLSHFDNPVSRLGSSSSCAVGLLGD